MLQQENVRLKQKIEKGAATSEEESKLRRQMASEKKNMEEELRGIEKKIQAAEREEEKKIDALESQKKDLRRRLDELEEVLSRRKFITGSASNVLPLSASANSLPTDFGISRLDSP